MRLFNSSLYLIFFGTLAFCGSASAQLCPQGTYGALTAPQSVALGDINLDGFQDVFIGTASGLIVRYSGFYKNGVYSTAQTFDAGSPLYNVATGDFNHDGYVDAVCSLGSTASLRVFPGIPFSLGTAATVNVTDVIYDLVVYDFNRDGNLDIATIGVNRINVVLGDGIGGFGAPILSTYGLTGATPVSIAVADVNQDGSGDLVAGWINYCGWLVGNGAGGFAAAQVVFTNPWDFHVAAGDLNIDGKTDAVSVTSLGAGLTTYFGNGTGLVFGSFIGSNGNGFDALIVDLNQDGKGDVVSASTTLNGIEWLAGDGSGGFAPAITYKTSGTGADALAATDLNRDGRTDVVAANVTSANISIFLGNVITNGVFEYTSPGTTNTGSYSPNCLAVLDTFVDGKPDVALGSSSGTPELFKNTGAGGLSFLASLPCCTGACMQIVPADFNNDGSADLAVAQNGTSGLVCHLLNSTGGWISSGSFPVAGNQCSSLAVADFNLDGNLDIVINEDTYANTYIYIGYGNGSFNYSLTLAGSPVPKRVAVGDIDRNGIPDVVLANIGSNNINLFYGLAVLSYFAPIAFSSGGVPVDIRIIDADQSGMPDIIVANGGAAASVAFFYTFSNGTVYTTPAISSTPGAGLIRFAFADMNLDGKLDAAVASNCQTSAIMYGLGPGSFWPGPSLGVYCNISDLAVADMNRDGRPDVVMSINAAGGPIVVALSKVNTANRDRFSMGNNLPAIDNPMYVAAGDLNSDGTPDLAADGYYTGLGSKRMNTNGCMGQETTFIIDTQPRSFALGDVNQDGLLDLIVPDEATSRISVMIGTGGGALAAPVYFATDYGPTCAAIGDIDNNGWPDVVTANVAADSISILLNVGSGVFAAPINHGASPQPTFLVLGDFNYDANLDIAVGLLGTNGMLMFPAIGNGYYYLPTIYPLPLGSASTGLDVGDLDQSGTLDIATANYASNTVTTFLNYGNAAFAWNSLNVGNYPISVNISDVDADGIIDMAFVNNVGWDLSFLFGLGGGSFTPEQRHVGGVAARNMAIADYNLDGRPDLAVANFSAASLSLFTNATATPTSVSNFGAGTKGCEGRLVMNANKPPKINTPDFAFNMTGAPRNSLGLGLVGDLPDFTGNDFFSLYVVMYLDFPNLNEFYWFDIYTDSWGVGIGPTPIPNDNSLIGKTYYVQGLAVEDYPSGQACSTSVYKLVTSRGLQLTIQP
ncbi:MAG: VCBS repeat-containing protein [Planctomycetes bacterium]|nr:VCBS repeat-containing protein [Planctomycetota bacterium]